MPAPELETGARAGWVDLLDRSGLAWIARRRELPIAAGLSLLAALAGLLFVGVWGTAVGNRNATIVLVWVLWWVLLMGVAVPVAGRGWCAVCPLPLPGEWLQRRSLFSVRHASSDAPRQGLTRVGHNLYAGANRRWPSRLSNLWLQTAGFLLLATFSAVLLTDPFTTAVAIGGLVALATVVALGFRQRAFCRYLCPVSGFLGLYASASLLTVRCRDESRCGDCRDKACIAGNEHGWGCPWMERPNRMTRSNACGLCLECVRACPSDNMTVFLRTPLAEHRLSGWDEAAKAVLMLSLGIAYTAIYLGPWGALKDAANIAWHRDWSRFLHYVAGLWGFAAVALPASFLLAGVWARHSVGRGLSLKACTLAAASAAVPLGLAAWIAFSVPLAFVNGAYVVAVVSDPLGKGWDLFGTAHLPWTPIRPEWMGVVQAAIVLGGHGAALITAWRAACAVVVDRRARLALFAPTAWLVTAFSLVLLWLHVG